MWLQDVQPVGSLGNRGEQVNVLPASLRSTPTLESAPQTPVARWSSLSGHKWSSLGGHRGPYAAIEPPAPGASRPASEPEPPEPPKPTRNDFHCGEKVAFEDKYLNTVVGTIVRINQRSATIDAGNGSNVSAR